MKDGQPIKHIAGVQITANGQKLIISQAQISNTGRYQCVATNEAGSRQREFNVIVQGKTCTLKADYFCFLPLIFFFMATDLKQNEVWLQISLSHFFNQPTTLYNLSSLQI